MGIMAPQRRGIFGAHMRTDMAPTAGVPSQPVEQPAPPQKNKVNWLGVLADALSGFAGGPANFANRQFERRQLQDARQYSEQTYQRRRQDELADYGVKQQIEAKYKTPPINDTVADFNFIAERLGPEAAKEFLKNKANPPVWRQGADMQWYRVDAAPSGPLPTFTAEDWDKAGQGGPAPSAPGGFR